MSDRFSVVQDPCGIFFLWDESRFEPVMDGDQIMVFVTHREAAREAFRINGAANDDAPGAGSQPGPQCTVLRFDPAPRRGEPVVVRHRRDGQRRTQAMGSASLRFKVY